MVTVVGTVMVYEPSQKENLLIARITHVRHRLGDGVNVGHGLSNRDGVVAVVAVAVTTIVAARLLDTEMRFR
jgi:hypothetical protein